MKNSKHILMTIMVVSVAILSVIAMYVFQPESTNEVSSIDACNNQERNLADDTKNTRKGVLVDSFYTESQMTG